MQRIFSDSITFADCYPKRAPEEILNLYEIEKHHEDFDLAEFVTTYFHIPEPIKTDYTSNQSLPTVEHVNRLWPLLTRTTEPNSSLLPVPHAYIVPGGRFRGLYYWDSYFTMLRLQTAGKYDLIGTAHARRVQSVYRRFIGAG
ncbi:trehalase family glycosidase [Mucilaginibacter sp. CSA2-8R]|uniref:trehalase family glycosidase n=1 Tax=Mucilaginibacter sp. CSA2-8R TaxID=3141542 RepID=UPI00315D8ACD